MPRFISCSTISRPTKPAPATTQCISSPSGISLCFSRICFTMLSISSRLRRAKRPGRSIPPMGGLKGSAPTASTRWSYAAVRICPDFSSSAIIVLALVSMRVTRWLTRTSMLRRAFRLAGVWTDILPLSVISPPMKYGIPHDANDTSGPD